MKNNFVCLLKSIFSAGFPNRIHFKMPAADVDLGEELLNDDDLAVSNPELECEEPGLGGIRDLPKLL